MRKKQFMFFCFSFLLRCRWKVYLILKKTTFGGRFWMKRHPGKIFCMYMYMNMRVCMCMYVLHYYQTWYTVGLVKLQVKFEYELYRSHKSRTTFLQNSKSSLKVVISIQTFRIRCFWHKKTRKKHVFTKNQISTKTKKK